MKIIADDKIPFLKGVFEPFVDVVYMTGNKITNTDLIDADVLIIRTRTICNEALLAGTSVKFIATATIGIDHIDTVYCKKNNIQWINAPGCNSGGVKHWFMAVLLSFAKQKKIDLSRKTLGVIGVGNVGQKIVEVAEVIGMSVILSDPPRERIEGSCIFRSTEGVLRECDIITFHVPLNKGGADNTFHMVNSGFIEKMNSGTILINSSRGEVMDTEVLKSAIETKKAEALLIDVWENEPNIDVELLNITSISTPHIAGYSTEGKANGTAAAVKAVGEFLGLPFEDWYPEDLPEPKSLLLNIDAENRSLQEVLTEVILETYPIEDDSLNLKKNYVDFEKFRSTYKVRREPSAWTINLLNGSMKIKKSLERLGFKVE